MDVAGGPAGSAEQAWRSLRQMGEIQFAPVKPPPPDPPVVLPHFLEAALRGIDKALFWIGEHVLAPLGLVLSRSGTLIVALLVLVVLGALAWLGWTLVLPALRARKAAVAPLDGEPDSRAALILLEDADRLAGEGRFAEAVHLLLQRSVADILARQPGSLEPSSTAREIATLGVLAPAAAQAFATMAQEVERARYALRAPGLAEWQRARAAYAAFAQPAGRLAA